jgi:hypothetical protein
MNLYEELKQKELNWINTSGLDEDQGNGTYSEYPGESFTNDTLAPYSWLGIHVDLARDPLDIVQEHARLIDQKIKSPTCCYVELSPTIDLGDGIQFRMFYRDQQDCVLWALIGPDIIVAMTWEPTNADTVLALI